MSVGTQAPAMVTVTIDGVHVLVPKGTYLVEAAKQIDREIPVYCYHSKMGPAGLCRICLVEIEGMPKLQIACNTQATDGMVVHTQSDKAADGRRAVLEFYLVNHPLDCPICDKGGECDLQDYAMAYGQGYSRNADPKVDKPKAVDLGPTIVLDEERCVVCQRCVRFDDIIVGEQQLVLKDRGVRNIIATADGEPYRHAFTGNVTELCPVGALTSKTYRFKSRPWDLRRTTTTCTQCPVGCQMHVDVRVGNVMRTMSVAEDDAISDGWLCDRGRYNVGFYDETQRLTQPLYRHDDEWVQVSWDDALALWATALQEAAPEAVGAIGGGRLTNEEAYLLSRILRSRGVRNLDWRAGRQLQATPGRGAGRIADIESVDAILVLGESPAERAPILDLRVRKAAFKNGAKLIRIGSMEPPYPAPIPSHDAATISDALQALPRGADRIAVIWDGIDLAQARQLLRALPATMTALTYITGEQPNARGAEAMGMHPCFEPGYAAAQRGRSTAQMFAEPQALRVLAILGANPALHFVPGSAVLRALSQIDFVVVSDLFMTQTAAAAKLVLPARGPFEKTGTTTNLAGDVLPLNAAHSLQSPPNALSEMEMLIGLAQRLDVDLPAAEELDAAVIAHLAGANADFTLGDERFAPGVTLSSVGTPTPVEGLRVALQTRIFAGGGTSAHDDSLRDLRPLPEAAISPQDAATLEVRTGDYVDLHDGNETMHDLLVEVRAGMPPGIVALIDGLPDDPANIFGEDAIVQLKNVRRAETPSTRRFAAAQDDIA